LISSVLFLIDVFALASWGGLAWVIRGALFVLLAIVLPGIALQRLARVPLDPSLVVPLGTLTCASSFWIGQHTVGALFPALCALLALVCVVPLRRPRLEPAAGPSLRGALPAALAFAVVLAVAQYSANRVDPATGEFMLDPLVTSDSAFHVGLTHEILTGGPLQVPGAAGFPLGYHLGTDLVRAAALRWAGVSPWDSLTRLDVTLYGLSLVLALRTLAARLGARPFAVALAGFTPLLTDFSFVFAANTQAHWWSDLLRGNVLLSLVYANPVVPALALALGALVALSRHEETGRPGYLALAALMAGAVPFFKVFLGAHLLLALGCAFLLAKHAHRPAIAAAALPAALGTAALALGQGASTVAVALAPLDLVGVTRETLGLVPLGGLRLVLFAVLWILLSLGVRVLGLGEALRGLRGPTLASAAAALALSGWPLGLLFRVSAPDVLAHERVVNDAAFLVEQSGPLLWLFTAIALGRWASRSRAHAAAVLGSLLLLATPATLQYAAKKAATPPDRMPASMVHAMDVLAAASRPGEVVIQRPGGRYPAAPVVLAGRRVTYERFTPYLTQFVPRAELEARHAAVFRFFRTDSRDEALSIARALGASYLALYGGDRVRFDPAGILQPIHEEPGARVYRIVH
jgi:hypothetical protein